MICSKAVTVRNRIQTKAFDIGASEMFKWWQTLVTVVSLVTMWWKCLLTSLNGLSASKASSLCWAFEVISMDGPERATSLMSRNWTKIRIVLGVTAIKILLIPSYRCFTTMFATSARQGSARMLARFIYASSTQWVLTGLLVQTVVAAIALHCSKLI